MRLVFNYDDGRSQLGGRILGATVMDELDREHRAEAADVADCIPPLLPALHAAADGLADLPGPFDEVLVLEHVEHGECGGLCNGIAHVRAADCRVAGGVDDLRLADHA